MLAFLCGAMEFASDGGSAWRERLAAWLRENLNHRIYNPAEEAERVLSQEELEKLGSWKTSDLERFRRAMRRVINHDLDVMNNQASYVICLWDEAATRGGGTQAELTAAYRKALPIYLVTEMPPEEISGWVLGCSDHLFRSFDELKDFLAATYGRQVRQREFWEVA